MTDDILGPSPEPAKAEPTATPRGITALLAFIAAMLGLFWFALGWGGLLFVLGTAATTAVTMGAVYALLWLVQSRRLVPVGGALAVFALILTGIIRRCGQ